MGGNWAQRWNRGSFRVDDGYISFFSWKRFSTSGYLSNLFADDSVNVGRQALFLHQLRSGHTLEMSLYRSGTNVGIANISGIGHYLDRIWPVCQP